MFSITAKFMTAQPIGKLQTIMSKFNFYRKFEIL